jgi:hypothetical protein
MKTLIRERLIGAYYWLHNRLTGCRCFAEGCGRLLLLHAPWRMRRCLDAPIGVVLTTEGMARAVVAEAEDVAAEAAK